MKKELDEKLFAIAPEWFVRDNMRESLMYFGFECGDGWYKLLKYGMERIKDHIEDAWNYDDRKYPYKFEVVQVKEKFGTLRFYVYGADDQVDNIISAMEMASHVICEFCGASGTLRDTGWIYTLCDQCYDDYQTKGRRVYSEGQERQPATQEEQAQQEHTKEA